MVSGVQRAYDSHPGKKALVRYEDLRTDTVGALGEMYEALEIPVAAAQLRDAVAQHGWERVPEADKGPGKFYRKASPGGWREDLTEDQISTIENATEAILSR